jgi:hypothetical protein
VLKNNLLDIRIWVIYVWFLEEFWWDLRVFILISCWDISKNGQL